MNYYYINELTTPDSALLSSNSFIEICIPFFCGSQQVPINAIPLIYGLGVLLHSHATISVFDIPSESVILLACLRFPVFGDHWAPEW